ncbi:MAG: hypothetical protein C4576_28435 [Desulfobacteraceae bacterium]|nr:MAG: hypothetical protein C4576_28435 [Desulfobacteraceae bacterium]
MKKIWITSLVRDEKLVVGLMGTARKYGLDANGHFWLDDLKNMAWQPPGENILDPNTGLWVILGSEKEIQASSVRYGLSMLTLTVQAKKGYGFHILWICTQGALKTETLPAPLRSAEIIMAADAAIGAKMVARANTPAPRVDLEYRLDIHANPGYGVWLELGPGKGREWKGSLLGVHEGDIDAHGVGEAGKLPQKSILEYPVKGMKLSLGGREFVAWAVQNRLEETLSYYARVKGVPKSFLFGQYAQDEQAEVHVFEL